MSTLPTPADRAALRALDRRRACGSTHHMGCACWEAERTTLVIRLRTERDAALNGEALALQRVAEVTADLDEMHARLAAFADGEGPYQFLARHLVEFVASGRAGQGGTP